MKIWIIKTTCNDMGKSNELKYFLLEKRLASCVQITKIQSSYIWNNEVQNDEEFQVSIKTIKKNIKAIKKVIRKMHTYEIPQIVIMKAKSSNKYLRWHKSSIGLENL